MASSMPGPKSCPHPSGKVRVVGRIREFSKSESLGRNLKPWVTVSKPQEDASSAKKVTVSFSDQFANVSKKDVSCELNYCYQQDEDVDLLFSREIRPLISDVFEGGNASVIAYGARGSGKTALIQGMEDKPGICMMTMAEFLPKARDSGKSVSLSIYEVIQEHAYDLLDPRHGEIQVFKDARGRVKLKGLSQVSVASLTQFSEYLSRSSSRKIGQKNPLELPKRSHKVVVIYLSSVDETSSNSCGGKMNFVDLAGYEDTRRQSSDGNVLSDSVRINKSLHALLNVIYALNINENHVPFRESKLTHILQESLGGTNQVILIACINPLLCQDTLHTVSAASRSCRSVNRVLIANKEDTSNSSTRVQALTPQRIVRPSGTPKVVKKQKDLSVQLPMKASSMSTPKVVKKQKELSLQLPTKATSMSTRKVLKKQKDLSLQLPTKATSSMSSGRKLEDEVKEMICNQEKSPQGHGLVKMFDSLPETTTREKSPQGHGLVKMFDSLPETTTRAHGDNSLTNTPLALASNEVVCQDSDLQVCQDKLSVEFSLESAPEADVCQNNLSVESSLESAPEEDGTQIDNGNNNAEVTPVVRDNKSALERGEENNDVGNFESGSPPLSQRLQEISANLKLFCSSAPSRLKLLEESIPRGPKEVVEPKTPTNENCNVNLKYYSPWDAFNKGSSRMKDSLVQESLKFLNSASKEELQRLKGIGEKRATYILELREESPEPFKSLEDLGEIGLSAKQIKGMMKTVAGELFN